MVEPKEINNTIHTYDVSVGVDAFSYRLELFPSQTFCVAKSSTDDAGSLIVSAI